MGASLPKAVDTTVVERHRTKSFRVGMAEMNGWRNNMEDAHVIFTKADWGFFGVYDGHGGEACSKFVQARLNEELAANGCPEDDAALKKLVFAIDKEFLGTDQPSGSTGTMCIVHKPSEKGGKHKLRVANIGDSRVLLGKRDGSIIDGGGTDKGLTIDHKPDHPDERERIYRCGGTVEHQEGNCARVNGDLAVSRAFGDRDYKKTGGPGPEDHPVTADPEFKDFECDKDDFLLLVCDGVSEGNFPNSEVVEYVAQLLKEKDDPGMAATAVCHKAVERDSKDNISCMVVLFDGADDEGVQHEFNPGSVSSLGNKNFKTAYVAMAQRAGRTLAKCVEERYDVVQKEMADSPTDTLREEAGKIGKPKGEAGSEERGKWFEKWCDDLPEEEDSGGPGGMDLSSLMKAKGKGGGKGKAPGKSEGYSQPQQQAEPSPDEGEKDEDGYSWSQKGEEVQIVFKLPKTTAKKDVKVGFKAKTLSVNVHGESLLDGALMGQVDTDDCTWCLSGGGTELQVMLTKNNEKDNWKSLLK